MSPLEFTWRCRTTFLLASLVLEMLWIQYDSNVDDLPTPNPRGTSLIDGTSVDASCFPFSLLQG